MSLKRKLEECLWYKDKYIEISCTEYRFYDNIYFKTKIILVINTCICGEAIKEIKEIISPKFRLLLIKRGQDQDRALRGVTNNGDIKYL